MERSTGLGLPLHTFSPAMQRVYDAGVRAAKSDAPILILGEPGVGKAVMAHRLHELSARAGKPMVSINCAAVQGVPPCELFGYERFAVAGATEAKLGLLERANGGTVFLDEIGQLAMGDQPRLTLAIEKRTVLRVGGVQTRPIDVRFIAATGQDLEVEIVKKTFRPDLYALLSQVSLTIPPLRERRSEIQELARIFLTWQCSADGRSAPTISPAAMAILNECTWHDNIRTLKNIVQRAAILCEGMEIGPEHLPSGIPAPRSRPRLG